MVNALCSACWIKQPPAFIEQPGMTAADKQDLENLIQLPHGIIPVTGPTGSGKSTTLYAILSALNTLAVIF